MQTKVKQKMVAKVRCALTRKSQLPRSKLNEGDVEKGWRQGKEESLLQAFDKFRVHFMFTEADAALLLLCASSSLQFDDSVNTLNSFQMEMKSSTRTKTL